MKTNFRACVGVSFLLVVISSTLTDTKCLDTDKMKQDWEKCKQDYKAKWIAAVQKKCAEDNKDNSDDNNKKCAEERVLAAEKKCKGASIEDRAKIVECWKNELGVIVEKHHWTFDQFEEKFLDYVIDAEKTATSIKSTLGECKDIDDDVKRWMCAMKKLGDGPCPELKSYMEEVEQQLAKE